MINRNIIPKPAWASCPCPHCQYEFLVAVVPNYELACRAYGLSEVENVKWPRTFLGTCNNCRTTTHFQASYFRDDGSPYRGVALPGPPAPAS